MMLNSGVVLAQESVILGGAGSMIHVAQGLAQAFEAKNPGAKIQVIPTTMGSTGGINAISRGKVTVALAARGLKPEESAKFKYHPLGRSAVVIAVNKGVPVTALTGSQVCDLFAGKYKSWLEVGAPEQKVDVLTRNEDDGSKESVRASIPCFKDLRESPEASSFIRGAAMVAALNSRPGAIGITELDAVAASNGAFKALTLDGVSPSTETVRNGKYKVVKTFAFVTAAEPQGLARQFLDFARSPEANSILAKEGIVSLR
jgi:phosphate transport system substrate-binding protein